MGEEQRKKGPFDGVFSNLFEGVASKFAESVVSDLKEGVLRILLKEETPEEAAARKIEQQARVKFHAHYEHFKRYHERKARGEKTNLRVVAEEANIGYGYAKELHMNCPYPQCQQQTRRRKKQTQDQPNKQKSDPNKQKSSTS